MTRSRWTVALILSVVVVVFAGACGGSDRGPAESAAFPEEPSRGAFPGAPAAPAATAAPAPTRAPFPTPAPAAPAATVAPAAPMAGSGADAVSATLDRQVSAIAAVDRIIVRTVDMNLVVQDVDRAIDEIAALAVGAGGWVVSSSRDARYTGRISFRVPAEGLEAALDDVRALTVEVESESSTSQDVTDEYTDLQARIRNLEATEEALRKLFDRADTVEAAIQVQAELTRVQEELERLQGRLNLLAQTSAFSLVNVTLRAEPAPMTVDAGPDMTLATGEVGTFRATFTPPEGIDEFEITWDFGDGSEVFVTRRTAPTLQEGQRITAAVPRAFRDEESSPYIVTVEIKGTGEGGVAEGEDTLIATVSRIPVIEVFAGEAVNVEEGSRVRFSGTFTRPEGLDDLTYRWEFGDGSAPVEGALDAGETLAEASHVYEHRRPTPFTATLTVTGQSAAGEAEGRSSVSVLVVEARDWVIADWNAGNTFKDSVRALSAVGVYGARGLIWVLALSPVWVVVLLVAFGARRWRQRGR